MGYVRYLVLAALSTAIAGAAAAADWPIKPIRAVVGFPPGGSADGLGRAITQKLEAALGQPVVVENKVGAGGNIAIDFVAKAPKDGYTILISGANAAINASLYKKLPFDFAKDLTPAALIAINPNVMVVPASMPVASAKEFVDYARKLGRPINFASSGAGGTPHLTGEIFKAATGLQMTHVPYKGSGPALVDLVSGQVDVMFDNPASAGPLIKQGRLKTLATTGAARSATMPDVPTLKEWGVNVEVISYLGLYVPVGTPAEIVNRINAEVRKIVKTPELQQSFSQFGVEPRDLSATGFAAFNNGQIETWRQAVLSSGAQAD